MITLKPTLSCLGRPVAFFAAYALMVCFVVLQALPAAAQGYQIRSGDTLRIEVLEDPSLNRTVLVAPDGRISVPTAGTLTAAGRTVEAVQNTLTQNISGNFASTPNVFVAIEQLAERRPRAAPTPPEVPTISVYVVGEANQPGKFELTQGTTVLQAFAVMGGFTKFAATKRIQLRRTDPGKDTETVYKYDFSRVESGGKGALAPLMDGDVIVIPQRRLFE